MAAMNTADIIRRLENMIRFGTVAEVDPAQPRCRVKTGGITTAWLPFIAPRAGEDSEWDPPSGGEQCVVLSPSGDPATGVVLVGLYSDTNPAPDNNPKRHRRTYRDGAVIEYDTENSHYLIDLPADGKYTLRCGSVVFELSAEGVNITGLVRVSEDVIAALISLIGHVHPGVLPGGATTEGPQ
jgi:phage baseplate assembly protein V